jgi:hypothetical protein
VSVPVLLFIVALVLALADEIQARGTSLTAWAVVVLAIALLWGRF